MMDGPQHVTNFIYVVQAKHEAARDQQGLRADLGIGTQCENQSCSFRYRRQAG